MYHCILCCDHVQVNFTIHNIPRKPMNINSTSSEALSSPGSLLVLLQCHIRTASCVLNTHVELAGGPAYRLGYTFLIHKCIF